MWWDAACFFRISEPHLKEMKWYVNVNLLQRHVRLWLYVEYSGLFGPCGDTMVFIYIQDYALVSCFWVLFRFLPCLMIHFCVPPELCWKSRLGRVGGVECQRCVSFVFIVLTGAQWHDCVAIWNPTPTQSFRGSEVGEMCVPLARRTMHFERPRNQRVIHPAYHQNHSALPARSHTRSAQSGVLVKYSHFPNINYAIFSFFILLLCNLSHYFSVPFEEWPASWSPQCDGQDHKAEQ